MNIDLSLFNIIHQFAGRFWPLDWLGIIFAEYLPYALILALAYFWFKQDSRKKKTSIFSFVTLSALLSRGILTEAIRFFYNRERPFESLSFQSLISHDTASSFPSGHAVLYFTLAFCLLYINKKWGWWFVALSLLMGVGRVFVGVHYPFDILGGIVVAGISVLVMHLLMGKSFLELNILSKLGEDNQENEKAA